MGVLTVDNVRMTLNDNPILRGLSIDFWEGHVHAVVGPNGAGKSTLASTIMGLAGYRKFDGDILLDGESIRELAIDERAKRGITLAWQEPARFEGLTVWEFLASAAKDKSKENLCRAMEEVGLNPDDYLRRKVDKTLSGGERKKVELASILAMEPRVAILDEPDSGIDIESIERIFDAVKLLKARGTTVILITHSLAVLGQAEHAFLLCKGTMVDKGSVEEIRQYFEGKCLPCDHKNFPELEQEGGVIQ